VMVHLTSPMSRGLFRSAVMESPWPTSRANVGGLTEIAHAEELEVDYARSLGIADEGASGLKALRALPAEKRAEREPAQEKASLSAGNPRSGFVGPIRDGKLVVEAPEAALASGRQAMVPVIIGANDRDLGIGKANSKDELFAIFGPNAADAAKLYDPNGNQSLDELKQQVFSDEWMTEPARHLADEMARAGQPTWLYRFSYVAKAQSGKLKGAVHASEIPYVLNKLGKKMTPADLAMAKLMSAYWVSFAKTGDPNGRGRPQWPRHAVGVDRLMHFTNAGVFAGPDPIKARLDLWQKVWSRGH
jgi:para-nitrobenzyl esterase